MTAGPRAQTAARGGENPTASRPATSDPERPAHRAARDWLVVGDPSGVGARLAARLNHPNVVRVLNFYNSIPLSLTS